MTHILTLETLVSKGACAEAQEKFARIFQNGALVAVETFVNIAGDFDWLCAARLLLTPRNRIRFRKLVVDAAFADHAAFADRAAFADSRATVFATLYIQQLEVDSKP